MKIVLSLVTLFTAITGFGAETNASETLKPDIKKKNIQVKDFNPLPTRQYDSETTRFPSRSVYLNGVNVSGVREETLENVRVEIDRNGNIMITAPHYEVTQESSYHPLLQSELPKFPREQFKTEGMPSGVYSKKSGKKIDLEDATASEDAPATVPTPTKETPKKK